MKSIHLLGAGGSAGVGMTRCLWDNYQVTGEDDSIWAEEMMECETIGDELPDLIITIPDSLLISTAKKYPDKTFLPPIPQMELCQDKAKTAEVLGEYAPQLLWIRDTKGAGGAGAQMASEYLPGRNFSVELVYHDDVLIANFQKERLSYSLKNKTTGLEERGSSMVSVCVNRVELLTMAIEALEIVKRYSNTFLNGFYGVDFKEDKHGNLKVTEINAGRLLTASYSYFWKTNWNLPLIGVRAFFGETKPELPDYPEGFAILRQVDQLPKLVLPKIVERWSK